jgi:RNA polymerase sigma factor (sigma-70 family)
MLTIFQRRKFNSFSDEELVSAYKKNRDNRCIGVIYERYGYLLLAISIKYLKNKEDAEDVVMDLFERLGGKLVKHEIQNFKSWLHSTIRNECLMILRKRNPKLQLEDVENRINHLVEIDEKELLIEKEIMLNLIESSILHLKEEQKKCVELFYLDQKSYVEIADGLSISLNQVKSAIQNGKRMLKIQIENYIQKNKTNEIESK